MAKEVNLETKADFPEPAVPKTNTGSFRDSFADDETFSIIINITCVSRDFLVQNIRHGSLSFPLLFVFCSGAGLRFRFLLV